ncbi:bifunctional YncE family protein/alkaline phosphatase family protein [Acidiphilium sp. PA]|uniref:bifunctional YncE family protein/alkaline phosphatase family protein n=1 Tax=Acidiphilium sp. PA TaxID=2871705 RepID=UPI002243B8B2|nr:bifunctional YncE family protein/alkaline phosphatase family protein [Acidiphilium sp. PA]MCW8305949.1 bifunctional YncE family protein/alkaline phosphatase family protein [Acidiphilium sp. PA]
MRANPAAKALLKTTLLASAALLVSVQLGCAKEPRGIPLDGVLTPSGQTITPTVAPGAQFGTLNPGLAAFPTYTAGQAVTTTVSPDGKTLLILTSGYNLVEDASANVIPSASNEYVFVYDISNGTPVQKQVLQVPDTFMGIAFAPDGQHFYVSGGVTDNVHTFAVSNGVWSEQGTPIALGHLALAKPPLNLGGNGLEVKPQAAGLAVTQDGSKLVVANFYNDSLSVIDLASRAVTEVPLRPGIINPAQDGVAGGEYPYWVAIRGNGTAYVSSERDREIDVVSLSGTPTVTARIKTTGNPNRMVLNAAGTLLYVSCDNEADVQVISTASNKVVDTIHTTAPGNFVGLPAYYHGTEPNSLALSPDGTRLYVTNGGTNSVAVIALNTPRPEVIGLLPTGYFPNSVSVSADGKMLYIVNGKSNPGPNPCNFKIAADAKGSCTPTQLTNDYILQLSKAGFLSMPVPGAAEMDRLTHIVAQNNNFGFHESGRDRSMMEFLHHHIKHVIYIVRENRTYDQILGDLGEGNSDPALAEFGKTITPNVHAVARNFVDLDNFYDTGEVSGNGWPWSTSARESDFGAKALPVNYAGRGLSYDWEGNNRNVVVAEPTLAARMAENPLYPNDPNLLPGQNNVAAPDGPKGQFQQGYIWDNALRAGLTIRNYGFFIDLDRYGLPTAEGGIPLLTDPYASKTKVSFGTNPVLAQYTDPYFRGFDNALPDYYREAEWAREFQGYVKTGTLPSIEFVRFMHDHTGSFSTAIDGVNTPALQIADNDYAVGKLIQAVAHSPYARNTLIFVIEDDAQDGPDHVDAHRSEAFIVGPYVKHHAVVDARYTTVNMIRTIEDVMGMAPMTLNDAYERPMAHVFSRKDKTWTFNAVEPAPLAATTLPISSQAMRDSLWHDVHNAAWWSAKTKGYDWKVEDKIPAVAYDHILWEGMMPGKPYPGRNGLDYSHKADQAATGVKQPTQG